MERMGRSAGAMEEPRLTAIYHGEAGLSDIRRAKP